MAPGTARPDGMRHDEASLSSRAIHVRFKRLLLLLLAAALFFPAIAIGQVHLKCKVQDPELQGSYSGGCKDGFAEGYGEAAGTAKYQGEFKVGRKHGKGIKTWSSGDRYEGGFQDDRKEGSGDYTWGPGSAWAGEKYSGGFRADRRQGYGVYEWPGGDRYSGPWLDDVIAGPATPAMLVRARARAEQVAAVGVRGARVCRDFPIGIAIRDRVRGTVIAVEVDRIEIAIEFPGKFQHSVGNVLITKATKIWSPISAWFPCH